MPSLAGSYSFTYEYNQNQKLRHITFGGSPYFEYIYDVNYNLIKRQHMVQGGGADSTNFLYDDLNRATLCDQRAHNGSIYFSRNNYNDYDAVNNLKSISREEDSNKGELFVYDDANQLSSVSYKANVEWHTPGSAPGIGGTLDAVEKDGDREALAALEADPVREPLAEGGGIDAVAGPRTVTYTNDAINRLSMTDSGAVTYYTPNHLNQYTSVTSHGSLTYDGNLNVSGYDGWTYVHDAEKRLLSVTRPGHSAMFVYDGLGRCVKRTIDGATVVITYDNWKPIVEWEWHAGTARLVAWNLYGPGADEILVRNQLIAGEHLHLYYHLDPMGNVQFLLSDTQQGLEKYTYDVFGKPTIKGWNGDARAISSYGNRFLFTGREYLYTFGLYDYRHRIYHPGLGRFIQTDPIGQQIEGAKLSAQQKALYLGGGAPEKFSASELNLYRYCHNNPINRLDPLGLDSVIITFPNYLVDTGYGKYALGHSGLLTINNATGAAHYSEYGRYDAANKGIVRSYTPDTKIVIKPDGTVNRESVAAAMKEIAGKSGQSGPAKGAYIETNNEQQGKIDAYTKRREGENSDAGRKAYDIMNNSCNDYPRDAVSAGGVDVPAKSSSKPAEEIVNLQKTFPSIDSRK